MPQPRYRRGDVGPVVVEVRTRLAGLGLLAPPQAADPAAEVFDDTLDVAVRFFQQDRGATVDGVVGEKTWRLLEEARWSLGDRVLRYTPGHLMAGDDVFVLQSRLLELGFDPGRADGVFGRETEHALRDFQRNVGLAGDGTAGPGTFAALGRLARTVVGGAPGALREVERIRAAGPRLSGKVVVVDPGHGGRDTGAQGGGLSEADVAADVAARVEGRLTAVGVAAYLTRGRLGPDDEPPSETDRAEVANRLGADLLLSLHADRSASPDACGVAAFYFGSTATGAESVMGRRFADLLRREVVARTDLTDCRSHPKSWDLLRATRMPAVRLELGYLTHPGDAARLADPGFRDTLAEAVLAAVQRLFLPLDDETPTGSLRLPDLASAALR